MTMIRLYTVHAEEGGGFSGRKEAIEGGKDSAVYGLRIVFDGLDHIGREEVPNVLGEFIGFVATNPYIMAGGTPSEVVDEMIRKPKSGAYVTEYLFTTHQGYKAVWENVNGDFFNFTALTITPLGSLDLEGFVIPALRRHMERKTGARRTESLEIRGIQEVLSFKRKVTTDN